MDDKTDQVKKDLEKQISTVARQAAHNAIDLSADIAVVEKKVEKLAERVEKLEKDE